MYQGWDLNEIEHLIDQPNSENDVFVANRSDGNGHHITQPYSQIEDLVERHSDENDESDSEEESEDDFEVNDVKSYKDQMDILKQALEAALAQNLSRQQQIDDELLKPDIFQPSTPHQHVSISKKSITVFCSPYFKNHRLYSHPKNGDTIKKEKELDVYISNPTFWTKYDKEGLKTAIKDKALKKIPEYWDWIHVEKELIRQGNLSIIWKNPQKKRDVKIKIDMAKNEIKNITNLSEKHIFNDRAENYNWMTISMEEFHGIHSPKSCELQWKNQIHPSLNQSAWSRNEDKLLKSLAEMSGGTDWNFISEQLGTDRTPISCMQRYMRKLNVAQSKRRWDKSEDELLLKLVEEHRINNLIPWSKIACHMECRTKDQCWQRYLYSLREDIRRGPFTDEEDMLLLAGVEMYGTDWSKIGNHFISRTPIQIFSRWNSFLKPDFQNWTQEEDFCLLDLVKKYGEKGWLKISKEMNFDRIFTNVQVSRRYKTLKAKYGKLDASRKNPKLKYKNAPGLSSVRQNEVYMKTSEAFENWSENYEMENEYDEENEEIMDKHEIKRSFSGIFKEVSSIKLERFMHHMQGLILLATNKRKHAKQLPGTSQSRKVNMTFSEEDALQMSIASQCINKTGDFPSIKVETHVSNQEIQKDALLPPEIVDSESEDEVFFGYVSSNEHFKNDMNEKESIHQLLDETFDILPTVLKVADTIPEVDMEIVHRVRPRDSGDGLEVEMEILNISNSDNSEKTTDMTLIPPNKASLMGFKKFLIERRHYENMTLGASLNNVQQRINHSEENIESRLSQDAAETLLLRRVVKLFLLPAKMSLGKDRELLPMEDDDSQEELPMEEDDSQEELAMEEDDAQEKLLMENDDSQEEGCGKQSSLSKDILLKEDGFARKGMVIQNECDAMVRPILDRSFLIPADPAPKPTTRKSKRKYLSNM